MKKTDTPNFDSFFSTVSRALPFIPILIILFGLYLKFNQTTKSMSANVKSYQLSLTLTPKAGTGQSKTTFDLKGPYVCSFKDREQEVKAFIKNKNVLATIIKKGTKTNYLLKGDCLYNWIGNTSNQAKKTCGLSTYVALADSMIVNNLAGFESMAEPYAKDKFDLKKVLESCRKEEFEDNVFEMN